MKNRKIILIFFCFKIVVELDYIIIDYAIFDYVGRKIWVENFRELDKVSWEVFLNAFQTEIDCIQSIPMDKLNLQTIGAAPDWQLEMLSAKSREVQQVVHEEFCRRYPNGKPRNILEEYNIRENQFADCLRAILGILYLSKYNFIHQLN